MAAFAQCSTAAHIPAMFAGLTLSRRPVPGHGIAGSLAMRAKHTFHVEVRRWSHGAVHAWAGGGPMLRILWCQRCGAATELMQQPRVAMPAGRHQSAPGHGLKLAARAPLSHSWPPSPRLCPPTRKAMEAAVWIRCRLGEALLSGGERTPHSDACLRRTACVCAGGSRG